MCRFSEWPPFAFPSFLGPRITVFLMRQSVLLVIYYLLKVSIRDQLDCSTTSHQPIFHEIVRFYRSAQGLLIPYSSIVKIESLGSGIKEFDMKSMETLSYACPHCGAVMDVEQQVVGENITCQDCQKLFHVEATPAYPIEGEAPVANQEHDVVKTPADEEREIVSFHPAMFRNHPFSNLIMIAGFISGLLGMILYGAHRAGMDLGDWHVGEGEWFQAQLVLWVSLGLFLASSIFYIVWRVTTWFITLEITTERSLLQRGLIARRTSEVRHEDVRNLQVDQSLFERLFKVGTLLISSSGQDDFEIKVAGIPNPAFVVETIRSHQ